MENLENLKKAQATQVDQETMTKSDRIYKRIFYLFMLSFFVGEIWVWLINWKLGATIHLTVIVLAIMLALLPSRICYEKQE